VLIIAFGSLGFLAYSFGAFISWQFGKTYPANHVYRALMAANDSIRAGKAREIRNGQALAGYDITQEFAGTVSGEPFPQLVREFRELGMSEDFAPAQFIPGEEYSLSLRWKEISDLRIPDFGFWSLDKVTLEVRVKFHSDTDYTILKSRVTGKHRFVF
jgi:hypothetical protein